MYNDLALAASTSMHVEKLLAPCPVTADKLQAKERGVSVMTKKQIIRRFHRLRGVEAKEEFMKRNGIKFTYDSFYNMTVFADDGTLQLFPIMK